MKAEWTTSRGIPATLELRDSKIINADGDQVTVPAWELVARGGTATLINPTIRTIHGQVVLMCDCSNQAIGVPIDNLVDIKSLVDAYWAVVRTRQAEADKINQEYDAHCKAVDNMMTLGGRTF